MGGSIRELVEKDPFFEIVVPPETSPSNEETINIVVDFSSPQGTFQAIALAKKMRKPLLSGTTGLSEEHLECMKEASKEIAILHSPNFSFGIFTLFSLVETMKHLPLTSIEIQETHHVEKKDSPSGTALALKQLLENASITSKRRGEVSGDHEVVFHFPHEELRIKHSAHSRLAFAQGALIAIKLLIEKPPGFYSLKEIFTRAATSLKT